MGDKIQSIIESLTNSEKDSLYRVLWEEHVKEDVAIFCEDNDIDCTDKLVDSVAYDYVYDGEYDCNLSYWDNIGNLIQRNRQYLGIANNGDEGDD